jgi:hypothetical protein
MFGELVHARTVYDTTVDTSVLTPEEAAARILDALQLNDRPRAFRKLRSGMTQ